MCDETRVTPKSTFLLKSFKFTFYLKNSKFNLVGRTNSVMNLAQSHSVLPFHHALTNTLENSANIIRLFLRSCQCTVFAPFMHKQRTSNKLRMFQTWQKKSLATRRSNSQVVMLLHLLISAVSRLNEFWNLQWDEMLGVVSPAINDPVNFDSLCCCHRHSSRSKFLACHWTL
jgi:hypothetical protein